MQRLYTIVIILLTTTFAQAQINEVQLTTNPILKKHQAEKQHQVQTMLQKRIAQMNLPVLTRDPFLASGACVESGELHLICIDTVGLGFGTTVELLNDGSLSFGTASVDTNLCINYQANAGIELGIDSLIVEVCAGDTAVCDTTIYPLYVHRANNTITLPTTVLNAEDTITICVDANALPSTFSSASVIDNNPILGEAVPFGNCIFYEANRFAGNDVVEFQVCDDLCVCDTYFIPITIQQDTLELPFMDDFSYAGPFPNNNWVTRDVFVNNTMSINPVSVGVATFDGLNEGGAPRGGGYGVSDNLSSAYLDLSPFNSNSNVWLSFYIEPHGLGEKPEGGDSLILEFKTENEDWILIDTFKYESMPQEVTLFPPDTIFSGTDTILIDKNIYSPKFSFYSYNITENQYLYKGFQFRFRNFSLRSGNIDHWHLDYVRLTNGVNGSSILDDVAFTQVPNPILKNYTSMPWWHFVEDKMGEIPVADSINEIHLYSHGDVAVPITPTEVELIEMETGAIVLDGLKLFASASNVAPGIFPETFPAQPSDTYPDFVNSVTNDFPDDLKYLEFEKSYFINVNAENPNVDPIVNDNNVVRHTTIFDNYFAYDDGTAETGLEATADQVQIALKFHANVDDTLKAVQFHFPHIRTNTSNQIFSLKVWVGQLDDEPEYVGILQKPLYIDSYQDSLNGFTTYILKDIISGERTPLAIPAGDFYVGWQQISDCQLNQCIAVGVDQNNPDGMSNVFFDGFGFGLEWKSVLDLNPTLTGSMMIRPVVGDGEPQQSSQTENVTNNTKFNIYPNPTNGLLNIEIENGDLNNFTYTIFDTVGKRISANPLTNQLNISNLQSGIYFLKIQNHKTNEIFNRKIVLVN